MATSDSNSDAAEARLDAFDKSLTEPHSMSGDTGSVTNRSVREQIMADEYIRARQRQTCGNRRRKILRGMFNKIVPPGGR